MATENLNLVKTIYKNLTIEQFLQKTLYFAIG